MRTTIVVLLLSVFGFSQRNPADYAINVHVSSSRLDINFACKAICKSQRLTVMIEGKKYELQSVRFADTVLAVGDYKAKLVEDSHKTPYESYQVYELLFPDQRTAKFWVVGQNE
jgi:hypothetical protein